VQLEAACTAAAQAHATAATAQHQGWQQAVTHCARLVRTLRCTYFSTHLLGGGLPAQPPPLLGQQTAPSPSPPHPPPLSLAPLLLPEAAANHSEHQQAPTHQVLLPPTHQEPVPEAGDGDGEAHLPLVKPHAIPSANTSPSLSPALTAPQPSLYDTAGAEQTLSFCLVQGHQQLRAGEVAEEVGLGACSLSHDQIMAALERYTARQAALAAARASDAAAAGGQELGTPDQDTPRWKSGTVTQYSGTRSLGLPGFEPGSSAAPPGFEAASSAAPLGVEPGSSAAPSGFEPESMGGRSGALWDECSQQLLWLEGCLLLALVDLRQSQFHLQSAREQLQQQEGLLEQAKAGAKQAARVLVPSSTAQQLSGQLMRALAEEKRSLAKRLSSLQAQASAKGSPGSARTFLAYLPRRRCNSACSSFTLPPRSPSPTPSFSHSMGGLISHTPVTPPTAEVSSMAGAAVSPQLSHPASLADPGPYPEPSFFPSQPCSPTDADAGSRPRQDLNPGPATSFCTGPGPLTEQQVELGQQHLGLQHLADQG
ncbi:hypothetical protein QJQ45_014865, partial [Haematococcus lacustris]